MAFAMATALGLATPASSQPVPGLADLPEAVASSNPDLVARRATLSGERERLHGEANALNARCQSVEVGSAAAIACNNDKASLLSAMRGLIDAINEFNVAALAATPAAVGAAPSSPAAAPPALDARADRIINGLEALARAKGWNRTKLAELDRALRALSFVDRGASPADLRQTWRAVLAGSDDGSLARDASREGGFWTVGAGEQTRYNDCTIFALATAAGLPYGVVAARATALIGEGDWRSADERAHPQTAIETNGLNGGEVVMVAETLGRAEVVPVASFADVLATGRPILAAVIPQNGERRMEHEVLLVQSFQHAGGTWYVAMDSNQGPMRRLYMSQAQLDTVLMENGIAYRPNRGTTPRQLGTRSP